MIKVTYAVCSEWRGKPLTRALFANREQAIEALQRLRADDPADTRYWIAELGPEAGFIGHLYEPPTR
jgi:hypothetical protein